MMDEVEEDVVEVINVAVEEDRNAEDQVSIKTKKK